MNLVFPVVFERSQQTVGWCSRKTNSHWRNKTSGSFPFHEWRLNQTQRSVLTSQFGGLGGLSFGRYRGQMVISVVIVKKCWSFIDSRWRGCPQCLQINCVSSHCIHEWLSVELKACNMIIGQSTGKEITLHWTQLKMSPVLYRLVMEEMMTSMLS